MAEPIIVDNGALTDYAVLVDDVVDATLGSGGKQLVGLTDATIGSTTKIAAGGGVEAGALRVTLASDSTGLVSVDDNGGSLTVDGTVAVTGVSTLAEQQTQTTALQLIDDTVATDGAAAPTKGLMLAGTDGTNAQTVKVDTAGELQVDVLTLPTVTIGAAIPAGTNNIGDVDVLSIAAGDNNIGNVDVVTLPALPAGTNNIGDVDVLTLPALAAGTNTVGAVNVKPATAGGLTTHHLVSAATTNATNIKASAGQVFGWYIYNSNAAARKVAFHNTAGAPTAGASVYFSIVIPPTSAANVEYTNGIEFSTGIAITMVTGLADADAVAVAANDLVSNIFYK